MCPLFGGSTVVTSYVDVPKPHPHRNEGKKDVLVCVGNFFFLHMCMWGRSEDKAKIVHGLRTSIGTYAILCSYFFSSDGL